MYPPKIRTLTEPKINPIALDISEVDGVVKTIFLFFLDAVPGEERVAEGERKEPVGRLEFPLRGSTITTQSSSPLDG
jgi:hypothetical protein